MKIRQLSVLFIYCTMIPFRISKKIRKKLEKHQNHLIIHCFRKKLANEGSESRGNGFLKDRVSRRNRPTNFTHLGFNGGIPSGWPLFVFITLSKSPGIFESGRGGEAKKKARENLKRRGMRLVLTRNRRFVPVSFFSGQVFNGYCVRVVFLLGISLPSRSYANFCNSCF